MVEILGEIFNSYADIHTFELGVLLGLFVAFTYRDHRGLAYALLFMGVFLAFGNAAHIGWGGISRKPWYFLSGVYATTVFGLSLAPTRRYVRTVLDSRETPAPTHKRSAD